MKYSIIVPVFNRPDEVDELLESLTHQAFEEFEVIIVEDGSKTCCEDVCLKYKDRLDIKYYFKENSGPGQSRNYGAERASGDFLLILDSDVVLPEGYLQAINNELYSSSVSLPNEEGQGGASCDAFGGPDAAHPDFTDTQKAISYSMTSFFTTGGIRGGKKKLDKFYPRSFNMGISRAVYAKLGGFSKMRFGEDIDFSYRIVEAGYSTNLFPEAWVWHKRRTDFRKFWRQVYNSGIARINLEKRHPGTMKVVHMLPMAFTVGTIVALLMGIIGLISLISLISPISLIGPIGLIGLIGPIGLLVYSSIILVDSTRQNKSLKVGLISVPAAFVQLGGYGCGFISAWWKRIVCGKGEFEAYKKTFYK